MKKISSLIILLAVLFAVTNINAQPQMKVHVYGGYNVPLSGLGGNSNYPPSFTSGTSFDRFLYMKSGFNAGADFKYFLGKKRNIGLLLNAAYNGYNTGTFSNYTPAGPLDGGKVTLNDVRIGIGAEYDFLPLKKANPFVGIDLTGNFLSGKFTPATGTELTMNSASRFGLAVGAGVDIMFSKNVGVVIGAKFDFMNLIGQQDTSAGTGTATTYYLYDKSYTQTIGGTSYTYNAINMMDVQFYGGVTFAFGQPKKMVKK